jgi:hypothetical protein
MLGSTSGLSRDEFRDDPAGLSDRELTARMNAEAAANGDDPDNPGVADAVEILRTWDVLAGPGSEVIVHEIPPASRTETL